LSARRISRRALLRTTVLATAWTAACAARVKGANESVRVALVGTGKRGGELLDELAPLADVRVVALCDPDADRLARVAATRFGGAVDTHADLRRVLDRRDVDVVVCATPDHWHALCTIWACEAGMDVYVEKPVSHDPFEGARMVAAAERHGRVVGGGFQDRSDTGLCAAFDWLAARPLGELVHVHGVLSRARRGIGARASRPLPPPERLDYDLWLGPASEEPILRPRFHHDWHWIWNYGCGEIGNHGPHVLDHCRWALGDPAVPLRVRSLGGRFAWRDAGETANLQLAQFDFGSVPVLMEVRALAQRPAGEQRVKIRGIETGVVVTYEHGTFRGDRGGGTATDKDGNVVREFPGDGGATHMRNFLDAVRARMPQQLHSSILEAHRSTLLVHLANASLRSAPLVPGPELARAAANDEAFGPALARMRTTLADWGVDDRFERWSAGDWLTVDTNGERFAAGEHHAAANAHLKRACRPGFVV
jgi:predicted dehydrogenase